MYKKNNKIVLNRANKNKKQECGCKETNASGENNMRAHI